MTTLFISDLHLSENRPQLTEAFFSFLDEVIAINASRLYILGDLFDAWIGDDDDSDFARSIVDHLQKVNCAGIQLFFMAGNRDFLASKRFSEQTGCKILQDPTVIDLEGTPTLIMHGDTLCTEDTEYLKFRQMVRSSPWQQEFMKKSLAERRILAENLRNDSQQATNAKDQTIMDVNQAEVERVMANANVTILIHGHTHRPATHDITINNTPAKRIVLGDWGHSGWKITAEESRIELTEFPLEC